MTKLNERILCRKLRQNGYTLREISNELKISKSTACVWTKDIILSSEAQERINKIIKDNHMRYIYNRKGCKLTQEHIDKVKKSLKGKLPKHHTKNIHTKYQSRFQGEIMFRSSWELIYAKYLDSIGEPWYYEFKTFDLGDTTYTPDFFLPTKNKYIEVKGYMTKEA